jgi:outer membrane protein TolC
MALLKDKETDLTVKFQQLLNQPVNPEFSDSLLTSYIADFSAWQDSIVSNFPLVKYYIEKSAYFLMQQKVAEKKGMPDITLGISYINVGKTDNPMLDISENGKDIFMFPSVSIRLPVYRKKYSAMIEEAKIMAESETFAKEEQINQLKILFEKFTTDYQDASRRIDLYDTQISLAQKTLDILTESYATATKGFDEVLAVENQLLKYQLEYEKAIVDQKIAWAFLQYLNGN